MQVASISHIDVQHMGREIKSIEVMGRRGKRHKHLLDKLEETRGYWNLKEEALCSTT